ncbi:MAG: serpin family protein [Gemmatimonadaceae bacterium]
MRLMRSCLALTVLGIMAACSGEPTPPNGPPQQINALPRSLSSGETRVIAAANRFAPSLFAAINKEQRAVNVFVSPLSASMALGMLFNGASGTTMDEMRTTLGFGAMERAEIMSSYRDVIALLRSVDSKVEFRIANSVWYDNRFAPAIEASFLSDAKQYFDAGSAGLDFANPAAVATINGWVKQSTNGKIESIVDNIASEIVMLLINAIYFKGDWRDAFETARTKPGPFTTLDGSQVSAPMMSRSGSMRLGSMDGRQMVELGYGGDAFVMDLVLPRAGEDVNSMVESLTPNSWSAAVASLAPNLVDLVMPRFKLQWEKTLNGELSSMGMPTAFLEGRADFTRVSSSRGRDLYISFVKQKTFVDVNEAGTEASAVTGVGVGVTSAPIRTAVTFDRPFFFVIRERLSGTILFMGKIIRPPTS